MTETRRIHFRGYTRPTVRGTVLAECIDLDILVEADTADEAMRKMRDALQGYLEVAFASDNCEQLLSRRSPLSSFALFWAIHLSLRAHRASRTAFASFELERPAQAAC